MTTYPLSIRSRGRVERALDAVIAVAALAAVSPVLLAAALGIRLASRGPVLYRARRAGMAGRPFTMFKLRTMHCERAPGEASRITAGNDPRVFPLGAILRRLKIDELPQLINVVRGDMAIVGPRPEDESIVEAYYTGQAMETLEVPPGLTSPGTLWYYTQAEANVGVDAERDYVTRILAPKLAIDLSYTRTRSLARDAVVCARTAWTILSMALGRGARCSEADLDAARRLASAMPLVRAYGPDAPSAAPSPAPDSRPELGRAPFVSVVIPCRNEKRHIRACLESIAAMEYPKDRFEVLVVDGMSGDGTREIVDAVCKANGQIRRLDNPKGITPAALNVGIAAAKGEVIVRMDAHATYPPTYVATGVALLRSTGADLVGGPVVTRPGAPTLTARCNALATSHPFGVGNSKFRTAQADGWVDTVPFGAFRRDVFSRIGLFDERLVRNQDNELNSRILRNGGRIYLSSSMTAEYFNQSTVTGLLAQAWRAGRWNVYTVRLNPTAFRARHFIPLAFVIGLIGLLAFSIALPAVAPAAAAVVAVYAAVAAMSAGQVLASSKDPAALLLPPLFFVYHVAYGTGSLHGVLDALWGGRAPVAARSSIGFGRQAAEAEGVRTLENTL